MNERTHDKRERCEHGVVYPKDNCVDCLKRELAVISELYAKEAHAKMVLQEAPRPSLAALGNEVLREELLRLQQWFKDRDRPGHKAQEIYIGMALSLAGARDASALSPLVATTPDEVQEWRMHMDLHLTEHDLPHAGKALRAAWPHVRAYLVSVENERNTWRELAKNAEARLSHRATPQHDPLMAELPGLGGTDALRKD